MCIQGRRRQSQKSGTVYSTIAADSQEADLPGIIGGDNAMPRTVAVGRNGEVVFSEQRSVTYEMLTDLLKKADG